MPYNEVWCCDFIPPSRRHACYFLKRGSRSLSSSSLSHSLSLYLSSSLYVSLSLSVSPFLPFSPSLYYTCSLAFFLFPYWSLVSYVFCPLESIFHSLSPSLPLNTLLPFISTYVPLSLFLVFLFPPFLLADERFVFTLIEPESVS